MLSLKDIVVNCVSCSNGTCVQGLLEPGGLGWAIALPKSMPFITLNNNNIMIFINIIRSQFLS